MAYGVGAYVDSALFKMLRKGKQLRSQWIYGTNETPIYPLTGKG